jgi:dienelactone hydrolase
MDPADARALSIPHIVLASKDEPASAVAAYADIIAENGTGGHVETYPTMWHGWMGARADLAAEASRAEYTRG